MLVQKGLRTFIGNDSVDVGRQYAEGHRVIFHAHIDDTTVVQFALSGEGSAVPAAWPQTTVGEIRQWLKEKARVAAELGAAALATQASLAQADTNNSPGAKVEGERGSAAPTEAAVPGPIGGDYVTGVGIQTPAPSFPRRVDPDDDRESPRGY